MSQATQNNVDWWKANYKEPEGSVVVHTPDPAKYHPADAVQRGRMGGWNGTMIPSGEMDGTSSAVDHNRPGVTIVDPDQPGGGLVFDPTTLNNDMIKQAVANVGGRVGYGRSSDRATYAAIAQLAKPIAQATPEELTPDYLRGSNVKSAAAGSNSVMPDSYVAPAANLDGIPRAAVVPPQRHAPIEVSQPKLDNEKPLLQVNKPMAAPVSNPVPTSAAAITPAITPDLQAGMNVLLAQMLQGFQSHLDAREPMTALPATAVAPAAKAASPIAGVDTGIPFLKPAPQRPDCRIAVRSPMGTITQKFHAVVVGDEGLMLVYDTRYEDGSQWIPPDLGDETMEITLLPDKKTLQVYSQGISFSLGCLDIIVLLHVVNENTQTPVADPVDQDYVIGRQ